jgi:hypothetical protein
MLGGLLVAAVWAKVCRLPLPSKLLQQTSVRKPQADELD